LTTSNEITTDSVLLLAQYDEDRDRSLRGWRSRRPVRWVRGTGERSRDVFDLGPEKILVVLFVALVIFGPERLPEMARTIGNGLRTLRGVHDDMRAQLDSALNDESVMPVEKPVELPSDDPTRGASFM
jgi:sec-independent protein translocase protein TatA